MERVSDNALLANLSLDQVRQVRDHVMDKISEARRRWHELGALADPESDEEIIKIFKRLDELEASLKTVETFMERVVRNPVKRAA